MRKIWLSSEIKGFADEYADDVVKHYNPATLLQNLLTAIRTKARLAHKAEYYSYVKNISDAFDEHNPRYKELLVAKPSQWVTIHTRYFSMVHKDWLSKKVSIAGTRQEFYKFVYDALGYEKLRGVVLRKHISKLGLKTCYYCNAQYAITADEEATTGQFYASYELDHCMPKAEYPYLSICFFNFHPSCSVCNKRKSKGYKADSMYVEKQGDVFDMFEFSLKRSSILRYMLSNDKESLEIDYTCKGGAAQKKKYDEVFHITSIYSQHKDEAEELLWKARCYQDADIDAIFQHYRKLFPTKSKDDFRRMLYGHHLLPSQVHKRPLNKMLSDIAKQMKII